MIGYLAWKLETARIRNHRSQPVRPRWPLELLEAGEAIP
jgi:hypothetical protein